MPWFKVDDKLHDHRKARAAGKSAMGVWVLAGSWSADNLTDGFVPASVLSRWGNTTDARRLIAAGLWTEAEDHGESGWQFHDWHDRQPSKESVEADRADAKARMAELRAKRKANRRNGSEDVPPNTSGSSEEVRSAPTRPDPTRPLVVLDLVGTSPDVPPEEDHNVKDEPRSKALDVGATIIAREYFERVPLCDKAKVSNVVFAAKQGGYEESAIRKALRALAASGRAVTPDTLRIELDGKPTTKTPNPATNFISAEAWGFQ